MNRSNYYNYIEERLNILAYRIESQGKLNLLSLHMHSENFYLHFFNTLFEWKLSNLNASKQNVEAIDLIDNENKLIIQVSSTAKKDKVESALGKDLSIYGSYAFKFISISKDATHLRKMTFNNPHNLSFTPNDDIYDVAVILKTVLGSDTGKLKAAYEFIKLELGAESDPQKLESNLAVVIDVLSKEDLQNVIANIEVDSYAVEKKISFNNLDMAGAIIEDYKIHYSRLDKIYSEFNLQGVNKSQSVLNAVRKDYLFHKKDFEDDELFFKVIDCVIERIQSSTNYKPIPFEELELCVNIIVVDAFIRCKIFKNPESYSHVTS